MLTHPALNNVKVTISVNQKLLGMKEEEKSINRKRPRNKIDTDFKDIKAAIINVLHKFKKVGKNMNMLERQGQYFKRSKSNF